MSITKQIAINFSNGTTTRYNQSSDVYIPFEVSYCKIINMIISTTPFTVPIVSIACPSLQSSGSNCFSLGQELQPFNEITHQFAQPKIINGRLDFYLNMGSRITALTHNCYTVGDSTTINLNAGDNFRIGEVLTFGTNPTIVSYNAGAGTWEMSSSQNIPNPTTVLGSIQEYSDMTRLEIVMDIEFYQTPKIYRSLQNEMLFAWRFADQDSSSQLIDVPFMVDKIEIVSRAINDDANVLTDNLHIGMYSDLINSSTNTNPLTTFISNTDFYLPPKIMTYEYKQPHMIRGSYRVWSNYMFGGYAPIVSSVFLIKFISYNK